MAPLAIHRTWTMKKSVKDASPINAPINNMGKRVTLIFFIFFRKHKMDRYRLIVTGKLLHLIKLFSERTGCLKELRIEPIEGTYELKEVEMETMRIFSHKNGDIEEAKIGTIQLKFKLIINNNVVHLANMSICRWQDPGNDFLF